MNCRISHTRISDTSRARETSRRSRRLVGHVDQPEGLEELVEVNEAVLVDVHAVGHADHLVVHNRLVQVVLEQGAGVGELIQREKTW